MTNSIGNKIQVALLGSISILVVSALVMLFINQLNTYQNQHTIETMTMEYSVISLSSELVQQYNSVVRTPEDTKVMADYQSIHTKITNVISVLKSRIISQESKILLVGLENTVNRVMNECDTGIKELKNNNFQDLSTYYDQANKDNDFVSDNARALLQKELDYLSGIEEKSNQFYLITITTSLGIFILIVVAMIFFARSFSKQLITPLADLSLFAKNIANGKLQAQDKRTLKITNDETGSLTESIYTMVDKLMEMVTKEQQAAEEIKKSSQSLVDKNSELERLNKLMVDRELKMIEMKKELEELRQSNPSHA